MGSDSGLPCQRPERMIIDDEESTDRDEYLSVTPSANVDVRRSMDVALHDPTLLGIGDIRRSLGSWPKLHVACRPPPAAREGAGRLGERPPEPQDPLDSE